jgi:hypothetical protein
MSGVTQPEYAQMMLDGGRSIEGARTQDEWAKRPQSKTENPGG